jgi:hypothetical protein
MRPPLLAIVILLAAVMLSACNGFAAKGEAESAVASFHQLLDAGRYDEIYDATDDLFKGATTRSDFTKILQTVHGKLGGIQSAEETRFFSREETGTNPGSYISITYDTAFEQGHATESFNWKVIAGTVRLVGYNVNSPLLIAR